MEYGDTIFQVLSTIKDAGAALRKMLEHVDRYEENEGHFYLERNDEEMWVAIKQIRQAKDFVPLLLSRRELVKGMCGLENLDERMSSSS